MLLTKLYEYSHRLEDIAPPMYAKTRVNWTIDLDSTGRLLGFIPAPKDEKGKWAGKLSDEPNLVRTSGVKPILLTDKTQYVLGWDPQAKKPERVAQCHQAYLELVKLCAEQTGEPSVAAVVTFLESLDLDSLDLPDDLKPGDVLAFRVVDESPTSKASVREWWATAGIDPKYLADGTCMVTGKKGHVLRVLTQTLKGIPGDRAEYYLISANANAFESYGLESSLIAPLSIDGAERSHKALNALLRDERTHLRVGPLAYVFWTRGEAEFSLVDLFRQPTPEAVKVLLQAPLKGSTYATADEADFYASALSASGGRAVVRDWIEATIGDVKRNLARWFSRMRVTGPFSAEDRYYGVFALTASLFRDINRENSNLIANTVALLMRGALLGAPLPDRLLAQIIGRNRAEQNVERRRIALTRMIMLSHLTDPQEDYMTELELTNRDPAYLCGRLLAVLEGIQRLAVPGVQATILDRYYGTASSAPATVFGTLLRGAQAHLAKLRKTRKPAFIAIGKRLEEITEHLPEFPRTLTLKQQALFSLGYYHQRAHDRAQAAKHKELADTAPDTESEEEA